MLKAAYFAGVSPSLGVYGPEPTLLACLEFRPGRGVFDPSSPLHIYEYDPARDASRPVARYDFAAECWRMLEDPADDAPTVGGIYLHESGDYYRVDAIVVREHSGPERCTEEVAYHRHGDHQMLVRTLADWHGPIPGTDRPPFSRARRPFRVRSGGQTGIDRWALEGAASRGFETGGWMPLGFMAEDGGHPEFAVAFGMKEDGDEDYRRRTGLNVRDSTVVLWLGRESPGYAATKFAATFHGRTFLASETPAEFSAFWRRPGNAAYLSGEVMIAGNRGSKIPAGEDAAWCRALDAFFSENMDSK